MNDHVNKDRNNTIEDLFNITLESFHEYLYANIVSLFSVCREFARNNDTGAIVNFSGLYGINSPPPQMYPTNKKHIGYCVSKSGVVLLTKYLATHLAPRIRVNCLVPGGVLHKQSEEFLKEYNSRVPLGRMMNVSELNGIIEYLCSDKSTYTTGSIFNIDGGWTAI
jgi:NAD(P)-dependent dehydrogenase (short-subunit alcohol dehydrogenase family)